MTKSTPLALALAYPGFSRKSRTTDRTSEDFKTRDARVEFLDGYLELVTDVEDARFHVRFRDNGIMSAPSEWHIVAIVRVAPSDVPAWIEGLTETDETAVQRAWWSGLDDVDARFVGTGTPRYYVREGRHAYVIAYDDGVVMKLVSTRDPAAPEG